MVIFQEWNGSECLAQATTKENKQKFGNKTSAKEALLCVIV